MASLNYKTEDGWKKVAGGKTGVLTFNGRAGVVTPKEGDYTAEMVGARPNTWMPNIAEVGGVNPNLLDNWYFGNPVNQRNGYITCPGQVYNSAPNNDAVVGNLPDGAYYKATQYDQWWHSFEMDGVTYYQPSVYLLSGYVSAGYTIDRWFKHERGTIFANDDSISINDSLFRQIIENGIENICGKTCCFSVLTKDGELLTGFDTVSSSGWQTFYIANNVLLYTYADGNSVSVVIETQNGKVIQPVAVKLEFGSTQTLAHQDADGNWVLNEIPDYNEELVKCQKYYQIVGGICPGFARSADTATSLVTLSVPVGVPMRSNPSASLVTGTVLVTNNATDNAANIIATSDIGYTHGGMVDLNVTVDKVLTEYYKPVLTGPEFLVAFDANL